MIETAKMSERGQIIIPREIRKAIRAEKNTLFVMTAIDENTFMGKKLDAEEILKEFRSIRSKSKKIPGKETQDEIGAVRKRKSSS